jgi:hypothetical protein
MRESALLGIFVVLLGQLVWGLALGPCADLDYGLDYITDAQVQELRQLAQRSLERDIMPEMTPEQRRLLRQAGLQRTLAYDIFNWLHVQLRTLNVWRQEAPLLAHINDPSRGVIFAHVLGTYGVLRFVQCTPSMSRGAQRREFGLLVGCTVCIYHLLLLG